jgi:NAD(P)-dependent dehydrogenase (short-subunit alcohol dehydrogenase family)
MERQSEVPMPTVLVTSANRGIGHEFVRQYAAAGWRVLEARARGPLRS